MWKRRSGDALKGCVSGQGVDGRGLTVSIFDKLYKNLELYNNILSFIAQSLKVQVIREPCERKHHARLDEGELEKQMTAVRLFSTLHPDFPERRFTKWLGH